MVGWAARNQPEITDEVCLRALPHQVLHRGRQGQAEDPQDPLQDLRERHHHPRRGGGERGGSAAGSASACPGSERAALGRMAPGCQRAARGPARAGRAGAPASWRPDAATSSTSGTSTSTAGRSRSRSRRWRPRCARAPSGGMPPLPPGVRRPPTPAAGRAHLPPPGGTGRSSASMPAVVGARVLAARAAVARRRLLPTPRSPSRKSWARRPRSPRWTPRMLAPEAAPAHARAGRHTAVPSSFPALADLSVSLPLPGSSASNGSSARPLPGGSGLEGLDFVPVPVAASNSGARRPAAMAAGAGVVSAPVAGGSTSMLLSQIGGRVARVRHPAIKYVITGGVLVGLIIVVAVLSMTGGEKKPGADRPAGGGHRSGGGSRSRGGRPGRGREVLQEHGGRGRPLRVAHHHLEERRPAAPPPQPAAARGRPAGWRQHQAAAGGPAAGGQRARPGGGRRRRPPFRAGGTPGGCAEQGRVAVGRRRRPASITASSWRVFKQQDHYQRHQELLRPGAEAGPEAAPRAAWTSPSASARPGRSGRWASSAPPEFASRVELHPDDRAPLAVPPTGENYEATFTMLLHGAPSSVRARDDAMNVRRRHDARVARRE